MVNNREGGLLKRALMWSTTWTLPVNSIAEWYKNPCYVVDTFWNSVRTEWLWYWKSLFFLVKDIHLSHPAISTFHLDDILVHAEFIGLRLIIILLRWLQRTNKHMYALYNSKWWVSFNTEDAPVNQLSLEWWASHVSLNISPLTPSGKGAFSRVT